ncbi:MAG: response regulator transcription factor [Paracoccaceae bacterium]
MNTRVSELSAYVLELNAQAKDRGVASLIGWAVATLADILGYDSAWYGWAQLRRAGSVIHSSATLNLPQEYFDFWTRIAHQDVLVEQFLEDPTCVPTYDRNGSMQTDGMETLADTFGLRKILTAMCVRPNRTASFYLSAYRGGSHTRDWTREDAEFLQCAVDQISAAVRIAVQNDLASPDGAETSVFLSSHGTTLLGLREMRDRFGHLWSRHDGDSVPRWLADYVDQPGEHLLLDQELVARCEPVTAQDGMASHKLSLRPLQKFDLLTPREREVAQALARGHSHKEVARLLGVAPSTIRNQTQSIYRKLGIDNRASLAAMAVPY